MDRKKAGGQKSEQQNGGANYTQFSPTIGWREELGFACSINNSNYLLVLDCLHVTRISTSMVWYKGTEFLRPWTQ